MFINLKYSLLFIIFSNLLFSQNNFSCYNNLENSILCEDFSNNLNNWEGHKSFFILNNNSLNNAKDSGVTSQNRNGIYLSTPLSLNKDNRSIEWSFEVDINFNPSVSNVFDIFLISDRENTLNSQNGFFIRIGDGDDYVRFVVKKSGRNSYLINFPLKILDNNDNKKLKFSIEYNAINSFWRVSFSINENQYFIETIQNSLSIKDGFFSILMKYNGTGSEKIFFSNLLISEYEVTDEIQASEVVFISELMIKPSPSVYLPNSQYLELFNPNKDTINIKDWKIETSNTSIFKFNNDFKMPPKSYVLIVWDKTQLNYFSKNIAKFYFYNLPQIYGLTPTKRYIRLLNSKNQIVDSFFYDSSTFSDKKKDAGWSLEKKDLYSFCIKENWGFSENEKGGTPGIENSILTEIKKENSFFIKELGIIENSKILRILFSENIKNKFEAKKKSNYEIENIIISNISFSNEIFSDELFIEFEDDVIWSELYNLKISEKITNCNEKSLNEQNYQFGITDFPRKNELIINEILYNPLENGEKFIEIYNNSERFLNLNDIKLVQIKNNIFNSEKSLPNNIILPKQYIFLAKNIDGISKFYKCNSYNFLEMKDGLPNISISSDRIGLISKSNTIIDEMYYENALHSENLKNTKGISLERINFNHLSLSKNNWTSASSLVGFATPGFENSNSLNQDHSINKIEIINKTFILRNGFSEKPLEVSYNFDENFFCTVKILNSNGFLIYNLYDNELFATKGSFFWNGNTKNSLNLISGIYILYLEGYSENGKVYNFKLPFVIGIL